MTKSALSGSWFRYGPDGALGKALALWRACADLVWPPQCPLTGRPVSAPGRLHPDAWADMRFIDTPRCHTCAIPFPYPIGETAICASCAARPPAYDMARSAFEYDAHSRQLVLALKHAGRTDALKSYGLWMARAGRGALEGADGLVPIPLHPKRLRQRRFNQSLVLAKALSSVSNIPVNPHSLMRKRATPSQGGLNAKARKRNVAGAFSVRVQRLDQVRGKRLVLVDDVFTTGATLEAAARTLKRSGAETVTAITLARVVKPVDPLT